MTLELNPVPTGKTTDVEAVPVPSRLVEVADCKEPGPGCAVTGATSEESALGVTLTEMAPEVSDAIGAEWVCTTAEPLVVQVVV